MEVSGVCLSERLVMTPLVPHTERETQIEGERESKGRKVSGRPLAPPALA